MENYSKHGISSQCEASILAMLLLIFTLAVMPTQRAIGQDDSDAEFTLNLKNADIHSLIKTVSMRTGKNFIVDPRVRATVNVTSSEPVDKDKLYEIFLSVLEVHGFTAVQTGQITKIVPSQVGVQSLVPTFTEQPVSGDELVSEVIRLQNIPAQELVAALRPLVADTASISAERTSNTIVITDRRSNIDKIVGLIRQMDAR